MCGGFGDEQTTDPRAERGKRYKQEKPPVPPAVEHVTGDDNKCVLQTQFQCVADFGIAYRPVNQKDERQKERKF